MLTENQSSSNPTPLIGTGGSRVLPTLRIFIGEYLQNETCEQWINIVQQTLRRTQMIHKGHGIFDERYWRHSFRNIGAACYAMLQRRKFPFDAGTFQNLVMSKNARYGDKPITGWGPLGVIIRISSKWSRYNNLIENGNLETGEETIVDTLNDIIGYCILGYCLVTPQDDSTSQTQTNASAD